MTNKQKKEFLENRTSWKWFENKKRLSTISWPWHNMERIMIEILKELQFHNDKQL